MATTAPSSSSRVTTAGDERLGLLRPGGREPGRAAALGGVAVERELRDHEQRRTDVGRRAVHVAVVVARIRRCQSLSASLVAVAASSVVGHAHQDAEPGPDRAHDLVTDGHRCASVTRCTTARMAAEPNPRPHPFCGRSAPHAVLSDRDRESRARGPSAVSSVRPVGAIDVNGVACRTPGGVDLLGDVSFRVGDGEHVALVGANGAGQDHPVPGHRRRPGTPRRERPRRRSPAGDATARGLARGRAHRPGHAPRPLPHPAPARRRRPERRGAGRRGRPGRPHRHGPRPRPHGVGRRGRLGRGGPVGHLHHDRRAPTPERRRRTPAGHAVGRRAEAPRPRGAPPLRRRRAPARRTGQLPRRPWQGVARGVAPRVPEVDPPHQPRSPAPRRRGPAGGHAGGSHRVGARRVVQHLARSARGPAGADRRRAPAVAGGAQADAVDARRVPPPGVDGQRHLRVPGAGHQDARSSASRRPRHASGSSTTR